MSQMVMGHESYLSQIKIKPEAPPQSCVNEIFSISLQLYDKITW